MDIIKKKENYIKNLLLKIILKKGKSITAKNLILNSSINISKNIKNFYKLFENITKNSIFPFKIIKNKNKYEYRYSKCGKSISDFIINTVNSSRNKNKRISFDFYFKNEMSKILGNLNNVNSIKKNLTNVSKDVEFVLSTSKKKLDEKEVEIVTDYKNKIQTMYKNINSFNYKKNNSLYFNSNKNSVKTKHDNLILSNEIKNLNFI